MSKIRIRLEIDPHEIPDQFRGKTLTDMDLHLQEEVTLFQARSLAKRIKQLSKEGLRVKVLTDEEVIEIK
jgi:hypothetical protein